MSLTDAFRDRGSNHEQEARADRRSRGQQIPSLDAAFRTWNYGGAQVGGGAAKLVSGAVIGVPQLVTDLPCELVGSSGPAPCEYVGADTDLGGPMIPAN